MIGNISCNGNPESSFPIAPYIGEVASVFCASQLVNLQYSCISTDVCLMHLYPFDVLRMYQFCVTLLYSIKTLFWKTRCILLDAVIES